MKFLSRKQFSDERGETLVSLLVSMALSAVVMAGAVINFSDAWRRSADLRMMAQTQTEARIALDLLAYDFRMLGSGMPLGQSGFQIDDVTLGAAALPVFTSATASTIAFRLNETGSGTVLSADYTPSASALTASVLSTSSFLPGDTVYLNNVTTGGTGGMQGVLSRLTATSLTFNSGFAATPTTTFKAGSIVERVSLITYASPSSGSGITRNTGTGATLLAPRSSFTLKYLTSSGAALTLPLTAATIKNTLAAIQLQVSVKSSRTLLSGKLYTTTSQQTVALRNLNMSR